MNLSDDYLDWKYRLLMPMLSEQKTLEQKKEVKNMKKKLPGTITINKLKEKGACKEGIEWLERWVSMYGLFSGDSSLVVESILCKLKFENKQSWIDWLYDKFGVEEPTFDKVLDVEINPLGEKSVQVKIINYDKEVIKEGFNYNGTTSDMVIYEKGIKLSDIWFKIYINSTFPYILECSFDTKKSRDSWITNISEMIREINEKYKKPEVWKPSIGEWYHKIIFSSPFFIVESDEWVNCDIENKLYKNGFILPLSEKEKADKTVNDLNKLINTYLDDNKLRRY